MHFSPFNVQLDGFGVQGKWKGDEGRVQRRRSGDEGGMKGMATFNVQLDDPCFKAVCIGKKIYFLFLRFSV